MSSGCPPDSPGEHKRYNCWHTFDRNFADGTSTPRFIREIVFGRRNGYRQRFFQITTDPVRQPPDTTWYLVSNLPGKIEQTVGDLYGWRTQDPRTGSSRPKTSWAGPIIASRTTTRSSAGGNWS
jgi:hypothetical protein